MRRIARLVVLALLGGLLVCVSGSLPALAAPSRSGVSQASDAHALSGARHARHHKKKHKKRRHKKKRHKKAAVAPRPAATKSAYCWPGIPTLGADRAPGAVTFRWAGTTCTTRYRVHVSPAWYGEWPGAPWYTGWTSSSARSLTWTFPTTPQPGDGMLPVAYANPVFGQLEANNGSNVNYTATHKSLWVAQWQTPPTPETGDPIRFGSYNVMLYPTGTRAQAAGRNIEEHGLTMVALQEARQSTAAAIVQTLNHGTSGPWAYVHAVGATESNPAQQIVYRTDRFQLVSSGVYDLANPKDADNRVTGPWASFRAVRSDASLGRTFYVTSVHFAGTPSASLQQNAATGAAATVVNDYLNRLTSAPTIVAGDLRYGREPWGDTPGYVPAQPIFVRAGYYDAMAALSMHGQNYSIVNSDSNGTPTATQKPNPSGLGTRSDNILMKGIVGSLDYYNVVNWRDSVSGQVPSDHNLIYSDIMVPEGPGS